jgi:uncharacterized protein YlxW (UPF0749 family)
MSTQQDQQIQLLKQQVTINEKTVKYLTSRVTLLEQQLRLAQKSANRSAEHINDIQNKLQSILARK